MLVTYSIVIQVVWAIVLELAGRFHRDWKITLDSWSHLEFDTAMERKLMAKFRRNCYPMAMGKRGLFTVKKVSVLKFFRAIIKGTFRALLTVGGKGRR